MDKDEGTKEAVRKRVGEKTELRHGGREREREMWDNYLF